MFGGIGQHNLSCLYWNFLTDTRKFQKQNEYRASKGDLQEKQKESHGVQSNFYEKDHIENRMTLTIITVGWLSDSPLVNEVISPRPPIYM